MSKTTVRDKRTPTQINTQIEIVTHWIPVLGSMFSLYSVYLVLASVGASLGERRIASHLGIGKTPLRNQTHFLDLAGLIRVTPGGPRSPNLVDVVDAPPVTAVTLSELRAAVLDHPTLGSKQARYWRGALFKRMDEWEPLDDLIQRRPPLVPPTTPAGVVDGNGGPAIPADLLRDLQDIGFDGARTWLQNAPHDLVRRWLNALSETHYDFVDNQAAFLRSKVSNGEIPVDPPPGPPTCDKCGRQLLGGTCLYCSGVIQS